MAAALVLVDDHQGVLRHAVGVSLRLHVHVVAERDCGFVDVVKASFAEQIDGSLALQVSVARPEPLANPFRGEAVAEL